MAEVQPFAFRMPDRDGNSVGWLSFDDYVDFYYGDGDDHKTWSWSSIGILCKWIKNLLLIMCFFLSDAFLQWSSVHTYGRHLCLWHLTSSNEFVLNCTRMSPNVPKCTPMYPNIPKYTQIYPNIPKMYPTQIDIQFPALPSLGPRPTKMEIQHPDPFGTTCWKDVNKGK